MKRLLAFLLLTAMLVSLAACGSKSNENILGVYTKDSNTYVNDFIGIGCKLDTGWEVFSEEQIAELNGMAADLMTDKALAEQLEGDGVAQPFFAQAEEGLVTVNITLENIGVLYGSLMDEKQYAEKSLPQIAPALKALGLSDVTTEIGSVTFAGKEHVAITVKASLEGFDFYETVVCMKVGNYMANITAGSYFSDKTGDVLSMFYAL